MYCPGKNFRGQTRSFGDGPELRGQTPASGPWTPSQASGPSPKIFPRAQTNKMNGTTGVPRNSDDFIVISTYKYVKVTGLKQARIQGEGGLWWDSPPWRKKRREGRRKEGKRKGKKRKKRERKKKKEERKEINRGERNNKRRTRGRDRGGSREIKRLGSYWGVFWGFISNIFRR